MRRAILVVLAIVLSASIAFARPRYEKEENPYVAVDKSNYYLLNETKGVIKITSGISFTYERIIDAVNFFTRFKVKYVVVYLNSPGGDLFEGLAVGQYMRELEAKGWTFEVRVNGLAASAASIILAAGTPGKRYMSKYAFLMVHELSVFEFLSYKNVSDKEKEARVLRGIQNDVNSFVASCTGKTAEDIYHMAKEETWVTAEKAVKFGFCDHVIGGK